MLYKKPALKIKKIKLNSFLANNSMRDPFSGLASFLNVGTAFSYSSISPPNTGTAGLKDPIYQQRISNSQNVD